MTETNYLYPATPVNVPASIIQPSAAFKKEVSGVMGSIVLFFIVYLVMFVLSLGLVAGCVYAGIALIIAVPKIIVIFIGLGLVGLGVMVFVFLIKFLFAVSRFDHSNSIEITEEEQPRLFAFIRRLTRDTQTPFPKRIYLSPEVNACVFYDSSFWSMFFPVKKNLQIGLGLVNSVNVSEFKAVMAHEFGHFSQRSMKLGSFVYNVNRIIYNMLFDNQGYAGALGSWARMDGIFAFFANLTIRIAQGIQWVLQKMYGVINKSYMRLSREMEFHADAVAASVSGSRSLVTALRRIELADTGYHIALQKCDDLFKQKRISANIYHNHRTVLKNMAEEFKLPLQHELPVVSREFTESNNLSRVNFRDQWASHPSTDDREQHLNTLAVEAEVLEEPAWTLFDEAETLQSRLTKKVYETVVTGQEVTAIDGGEFDEKYAGDIKQFSLPAAYNGFYDGRQVPILDIAQWESFPQSNALLSGLFSLQHATLHKKIRALAADIEVLKAIAQKNIATQSFDFDGVKYGREEADTIAAILEKEKQNQERELEQIDKTAIRFFIEKAGLAGEHKAEELKAMYGTYFSQRQKAEEFLVQVNAMLESLRPLYEGQSTLEEVNIIVGALRQVHEPKFKDWLKQWLAGGVFDVNPVQQQRVRIFIDNNYAYFSGTSFFDSELQELNDLCTESWSAVHESLFGKFKQILEKQLAYNPEPS